MDVCGELERGLVVRTQAMAFELSPGERRFLSPSWASEAAKNVNLRPGAAVARGASGSESDLAALGAMMARYAAAAEALLDKVVPRYTAGRTRGNTSFRPIAISD